uniref:Uncharacterized protein LOC104224350 n=1 Tax=Nicotiana sylvestris TaxID=4096 RepID=A0A1U7WJ52_NICSY|nr:PREDICTED: uncharacterized protein LOC104224350 [Nicotiana sylvestris]
MWSYLQSLTSLVAAQDQRQNEGDADKPVSVRVCDFIKLHPPLFTGSDPKKYPQTFIDQVHHTLWVMHASDTEAVELAYYRLRDLAIFWYDSWERSRGLNALLAVWKEFSKVFLCDYLPIEKRRGRANFLNLRQGMDISRIQDYAQMLKDRKHQQKADREQGSVNPQSSRSSAPPAASSSPQFQRPRYDRFAYSGLEQSSRASSSQYHKDTSQTRPSTPCCDYCSKDQFGLCHCGSDACYSCG